MRRDLRGHRFGRLTITDQEVAGSTPARSMKHTVRLVLLLVLFVAVFYAATCVNYLTTRNLCGRM